MDFDSPEVMKDFPGLYMSEKRKGSDNDYNDENEKASKKDMIIGKRKDKKDKKDKDKGYAALEGESSDEASPCKTKKSKAFIFTKSKDKEHSKDKGECSSKTRTKKKGKLGFGNKFSADGNSQSIADALPIFGADLASACQRGKCHDGVHIPLPVRECIDFVEQEGLNFEYVYKTSGNKTKVQHIRKMYNNRQTVTLSDYDVPTVTSVLKAFLRDLPEPLFTNDLLIRFEEAGAILNYHTREKHLRSLINMLPLENRVLLSYLIMHFHNVVQRDQVNKMNKQNLAQAINHTLHVSSRLLQALITHRIDLYPELQIVKYVHPLDAASSYPDDPVLIEKELAKLESALNVIHWEMQQGFCSSWRQDQLWDVQRVQTDLKRKLKKEINQPHQAAVAEDTDGNEEQSSDLQDAEDDAAEVADEDQEVPPPSGVESNEKEKIEHLYDEPEHVQTDSDNNSYDTDEDGSDMGGATAVTERDYLNGAYVKNSPLIDSKLENSYTDEDLSIKDLTSLQGKTTAPSSYTVEYDERLAKKSYYNDKINCLHFKNQLMMEFIQRLEMNIAQENKIIDEYKRKIEELVPPKKHSEKKTIPPNFEDLKHLLQWENHMLEIKKLELVRKIVESEEQCMDLKAEMMGLRSLAE